MRHPAKGAGPVCESKQSPMAHYSPSSSSGMSSSSCVISSGNDDWATDTHSLEVKKHPLKVFEPLRFFFFFFPMLCYLLRMVFQCLWGVRTLSMSEDYARSKKNDDYGTGWGEDSPRGSHQLMSGDLQQVDSPCSRHVSEGSLSTVSDRCSHKGMESVDAVPCRALANELISQCLEREAPESVQTTFRINACTWNVDQHPPPDSGHILHECLLGRTLMQAIKNYRTLQEEYQETDTRKPPTMPLEDFPDMVIVSLQEVEMGGVVLVKEYTDTCVSWAESIVESLNAASERKIWYRKLKVVQLVGLVLIIVARVEHVKYVANIHASIARTGAMRGVWGNKGSVGVRATIYGKRFLLIAAHFVAHKNNERKRTLNYHVSLGDLCFKMSENADDELDVLQTFGNGYNAAHSSIERRTTWKRLFQKFACVSCGLLERRVLDQHDYVFFLGDLNSRLHGVKSADIRQLVGRAEFNKLICHDELRQGMISGDTFDGFQEALITFPPTYKFDRGTDDYDTSRKRRDPAWCDRILFRVGLPSGETTTDTVLENTLGGNNYHHNHSLSVGLQRETEKTYLPRAHTMPDPPYGQVHTQMSLLQSMDSVASGKGNISSAGRSNDVPLTAGSDTSISDTRKTLLNILETTSMGTLRTPVGTPPLPTFLSVRQSVSMEKGPSAFQMVPNRVDVLDYHHVPSMRQSDHRPVCAQFVVLVLSLQKELVDDVMQRVREQIGDDNDLFDFSSNSVSSSIMWERKKEFASARLMQLGCGDERFSVRIATASKRSTTCATQAVVGAQASGKKHVAGAGAQVPLRSRTVASPQLQLHTYHDNAAMRDALERMKLACGLLQLDDAEEMMMMNPALYIISDSICSNFNNMPGHVIVYCFCFCDMVSLCRLAYVNRRFNALSHAHNLWESHARLLNIPTRSPKHAHEDIRRVALEQRERWQVEVQRHEREYEELERRLHERAAAERAVPLNVNVILSGSRNRGGGFSAGVNGGSSSIPNSRVTGTRDERELCAQLEQLESIKNELLQSVCGIKSTLAQEQKKICELQKQVMNPYNAEGGEEGGMGASLGLTNTLSFADVECFERRICRIVLSAVNDLPLVLRRGIDDFSTMELLCLHGGGDVGGRVRQRWAAFKRFFPPMSEEYGTVRALLASDPPHSPSNRVNETVSNLGSVIRRVQQMTDDEILKIVM